MESSGEKVEKERKEEGEGRRRNERVWSAAGASSATWASVNGTEKQCQCLYWGWASWPELPIVSVYVFLCVMRVGGHQFEHHPQASVYYATHSSADHCAAALCCASLLTYDGHQKPNLLLVTACRHLCSFFSLYVKNEAKQHFHFADFSQCNLFYPALCES